MAKQEYDPTNTAAAWANEGHLENDKQPALRMKLNVEGTDYKVSLFQNSYFSEDEGLNADIADLIAELIELTSEAGGSSPLFKGKVEVAEARGGGGSTKRSSRRGGASKRAPRSSNEETTTTDKW